VAERELGLSSADFRHVMSHFCTGVVVVTAALDGVPVGLTCQSFVAVSLEPPLVLFCAAHSSTSWPKVRSAGRFCANVLSSSQREIGETFAQTSVDKFAGVQWSPSTLGSPAIAGCLAHVDCVIDEVRSAGDHDVVIGAVRDLRVGDAGAPLLYYKSSFAYLADGTSG
jgi:3-hydroxy-9,10-secoandrosta-1,3,5(10)-triene-9,17-dione monooxygenase reductase component